MFLNLKHCLTEHPSVEQNILKLKEAAKCKNAVHEGLISLANHPTVVSGQDYLLLVI